VERGTALFVDFQTTAEIEAAQAAAQAQLEAEQNALIESETKSETTGNNAAVTE
jgi:hypothetical protein